MCHHTNHPFMIPGRGFSSGLFVVLILVLIPGMVEAHTVNPGETVRIGDFPLDISQAIGTSTAIGWWKPGADITNSPPEKVLLIGINGTDFSVHADDFVEYPGNWYRYDAAVPNRAGQLAFIVYGYCGTDICPRPEIVSTPGGRDRKHEVSASATWYPGNYQIWITDSIGECITSWNERMHWGFTPLQIEELSRELNSTLLPHYRDPQYPGFLTVPNQTKFYREVGVALGLSQEQSETFAGKEIDYLESQRMRGFESQPDVRTPVPDPVSEPSETVTGPIPGIGKTQPGFEFPDFNTLVKNMTVALFSGRFL